MISIYTLSVSAFRWSLDATYLALDWPWLLPQAPESWPHTTHTRNLLDIENEETVVVVLLTLETNRFTSRHLGVVQSLGSIYTEHDVVADGLIKTHLPSRSLIDVVDESIVQVMSLKIERIEPVLASVDLVLLVLGTKSSAGEGREDGTNTQKEG